jgi:hypothetical protein
MATLPPGASPPPPLLLGRYPLSSRTLTHRDELDLLNH